MNTARLLIVDDEPNVRLVIQRSLANQGYQLDTAASGVEALERIKQTNYDLVLLDLQLGPVSGIQVLNALRQQGRDSVVIILTAHGTMESAVDAIHLSAFDYLFKPASPETIRLRVSEGLAHRQASLRKEHLLGQIDGLRQALYELDKEDTAFQSTGAERFIRSGGLVIDQHRRAVTLDERLLDLTTTEYNLLLCLVKASPQPVSPRQLVHSALGYEVPDSEASEIVKWHIHQLRQKMEPLPQQPRYIKTVRYQGYLWSG